MAFKGVLAHPKSRWWCGIGLPLCLAGFVLLVVSTVPLGQIALTTALVAIYLGVRELIIRGRR